MGCDPFKVLIDNTLIDAYNNTNNSPNGYRLNGYRDMVVN